MTFDFIPDAFIGAISSGKLSRVQALIHGWKNESEDPSKSIWRYERQVDEADALFPVLVALDYQQFEIAHWLMTVYHPNSVSKEKVIEDLLNTGASSVEELAARHQKALKDLVKYIFPNDDLKSNPLAHQMALWVAGLPDSINLIGYFLKRSVPADTYSEFGDENLLIRAIKNNCPKNVIRILNHGANPNWRCPTDANAAHWAFSLLKNSSYKNPKSKEELWIEYTQVMEKLIEKNVDLKAITFQGHTPLMLHQEKEPELLTQLDSYWLQYCLPHATAIRPPRLHL